MPCAHGAEIEAMTHSVNRILRPCIHRRTRTGTAGAVQCAEEELKTFDREEESMKRRPRTMAPRGAVLLLLLSLHGISVGGQKCRQFSTKVGSGICKGLSVTFSSCEDKAMQNLTDSQLSEGLGAIIIKGTSGCSVSSSAMCASLGPGVLPAISACDKMGAMCMAYVGGMRSAECSQDSDCDGDTGSLKAEAMRLPCCEGSRRLITGVCTGVDVAELDKAIEASKSMEQCRETECYDPSSAPSRSHGSGISTVIAAAALTVLGGAMYR